VLPLLAPSVEADLQVGLHVLALTLAIVGEILGRYLFFVSVVPKHMAAPYVAVEGEAA